MLLHPWCSGYIWLLRHSGVTHTHTHYRHGKKRVNQWVLEVVLWWENAPFNTTWIPTNTTSATNKEGLAGLCVWESPMLVWTIVLLLYQHLARSQWLKLCEFNSKIASRVKVAVAAVQHARLISQLNRSETSKWPPNTQPPTRVSDCFNLSASVESLHQSTSFGGGTSDTETPRRRCPASRNTSSGFTRSQSGARWAMEPKAKTHYECWGGTMDGNISEGTFLVGDTKLNAHWYI